MRLVPGQRFCLYGIAKTPRGRGYTLQIMEREKLPDGSRLLNIRQGRSYRTQKEALADTVRLNRSLACPTTKTFGRTRAVFGHNRAMGGVFKRSRMGTWVAEWPDGRRSTIRATTKARAKMAAETVGGRGAVIRRADEGEYYSLPDPDPYP